MQKVEKYKADGGLCEIYSTGFQLAFVSPNLEQCHKWVLCKDFMTDALWATFHQKSVSIYGFRYDPATDPALSIDPLRLVVRDKTKGDKEFDEQIQRSHEFLLILEQKLGFDSSTLEKVEHGDGGSVWMFTVDKRWIHAPPLFSMLSLFLRVGCHYKGNGKLNDAIRDFKKVSHNDASYLKQSRNLRHLILKKGLAIFAPKMEDNYPKADIDTIHNSWGIVNAAKCHTFKTLWNLEGLETVVKKKAKKKVAKKKTATKKVGVK